MLRFFGLRSPKISSCYTTSTQKGRVHKLVGHALVLCYYRASPLKILLDIIAYARDKAIDSLDGRPSVVGRGEQTIGVAESE